MGLFDANEGRRYPPATALTDFLQQHPFLYLTDANGRWQATLHSATGLLWNHSAAESNSVYTVNRDKDVLAEPSWAGLTGWRLPSKDELQTFATADGNPHRAGHTYRLPLTGEDAWFNWHNAGGRCDVDSRRRGVDSSIPGNLFICHSLTQSDPRYIFLLLADRGWTLESPDSKARFSASLSKPWPNEAGALLRELSTRGERLVAGERQIALGAHPALLALQDLDWQPSRLPKLELGQLSDPHKGLWELWGTSRDRLDLWGLVARDPARDLVSYPVAIDFGTSSTVVALDDGQRTCLLRVGARDFYAPETAKEFENPTVLECLDFSAFAAVWRQTAYRPAHDWDWLRVGHEAQAAWRDNPGEPEVLAAILPKMKQWALRGEDAPTLRLFDRKSSAAIEIAPLRDRRPVRGQPLQVRSDDPFDPIEFYAFQLGMVINWRGRGLFTRYYLSFPVKYEKSVKERVLASFARGLQRSLPATLIDQRKVLQEFSVEELASEPAAYAAAALRHLKLAPTDSGLAYAVFDFGGGTSDFDYGLWRWATAEEDADGYEEVFEHLASAGDNFLGGENLLENMAFRVFCDNLDALRGARIHFNKPLDAFAPSAAEAFIQPTHAAQTNMVMLMTRLRPFWESSDGQIEAQIKLDLLNADGVKCSVELAVDGQALEAYLASRIEEGVRVFLHELARAFAAIPVSGPVHVLLAGNASHSRHVRALFDPACERWQALLQEVFGDAPPVLEVHPPLPVDNANIHAPTAKTGVALGLLRLAPGRKVKIINHVRAEHGDEAPFRFFLGRLRRSLFQPALTPDTRYGQWHELGPIAQGIFDLRYTMSPRARQEMRDGDPELYSSPMRWPEARDGDRLWVRAVAPNVIETCCLRAGQLPTEKTPVRKETLHVGKER